MSVQIVAELYLMNRLLREKCLWWHAAALLLVASMTGCEEGRSKVATGSSGRGVSVQTSKGLANAGVFRTHIDLSYTGGAMIITLDNNMSGLAMGSKDGREFIILDERRIEPKEGAVILWDRNRSTHYIVDGVEWDVLWFDDEEKLRAFVKSVVEEHWRPDLWYPDADGIGGKLPKN